jgi:hypothetical protein
MKMKKFTKKERHDIYVKMLEFIKDEPCGFCFALKYSTLKSYKLEKFPELMRHEPDELIFLLGGGGPFWFYLTEEGIYTRQFILMAAIRDTE